MELSLDLRLDIFPRTISEIIAEVSELKDSSKKMMKIGDYLRGLEEEMRKIDVFKRELPLCMLLLSDVILTLKEESEQFKKFELQNQTHSKEFASLQVNSDGNGLRLRNDCVEKKDWMSSTQLWSSDITFDDKNNDSNSDVRWVSGYSPENQIHLRNRRNRDKGFEEIKDHDDGESSDVPNLTLMTQISDLGSENSNQKSKNRIRTGSFKTRSQQPSSKKWRRCWSPELHRRFVDALQRLGGLQAATPKQIRDIMQVDGLTNDEVKSHLQKYRLHVRKLDSPQAHSAIEGDNVQSEEENDEK